MRCVVNSWKDGERDQSWKAISERRARSIAETVIGEYGEQGVTEFEVMISSARSGEMLDFFSSAQGVWQGPLPPMPLG